MNEDIREDIRKEPFNRRYYIIAAVFSAAIIILLLVLIWAYAGYYENAIGQEQPIPFSHRVHVAKKKIGCFMCHSNAINQANAGIPPLETCMLCHKHVIIHYPPVKKLRDHYYNKKPVEWNKVNNVPDFVYFNHSVHLGRAIDCGECHGNVAVMDRVVQPKVFEMGFCVDCHRKNKVTIDCLGCHR